MSQRNKQCSFYLVTVLSDLTVHSYICWQNNFGSLVKWGSFKHILIYTKVINLSSSPYLSFKKLNLYFCVCVWLYVSVYNMCMGALEGQKMSNLLGARN